MDELGAPKFIVDQNVGKLTKWLRILGYDTIFFRGSSDSRMIAVALAENRVILTRDTHIMCRRVVAKGLLQAILIQSEYPEEQIQQVIATLNLDCRSRPFTLCLECNQPLWERSKEQVRDLVPPYVFKTQSQYRQCPSCQRIYWRGTHWQAMTTKVERFKCSSA